MYIPTGLEGVPYDPNKQNIEGQTGQTVSEVDPLLLNVSDDQILQEIEERLESVKTETESLRAIQKDNMSYYLGNQLGKYDLSWQDRVVENRIFMSVETLIPMVTSNAGDPDIRALAYTPDQAQAVSDYTELLQLTTTYDYDVTFKLRDKVRQIARNWFYSRVGFGKFRLDPETKEIVFEAINPLHLILPGKESPKGWKAEFKENTVRELLAMFPKAKDKIATVVLGAPGEIPETMLGTKLGWYEYWRDTFVACKLEDQILDKKLNPNWDWSGEERLVGQKPVQTDPNQPAIMQDIKENFFYNIMDRPRMPYFKFNYFKTTNSEYDDTSLVEQAKSLQDLINKRKRQVSAVADDAGLVIASGADGNGITQEEFAKYDGRPRATLWIPGGNPGQVFTRLPGAQVNQGMLDDLADSRQAVDNIFGTQNVSRGQANGAGESAAAREILRQADVSRVGPLAETVEDFLQQVYMYGLQMRMMFTTEDYIVPALTQDDPGDSTNFSFNRNNVPFIKVKEMNPSTGKVEEFMKPVPITLRVRRESTMPKDPVADYNRNLEMFRLGLKDPYTIFQEMGDPNAQKKLERLFKWHTFPLTMMSQKLQEELMPLLLRPNHRMIETLKYENAPADIKRQMEDQAGFKPSNGLDDVPPTKITETINFKDATPEIQQAMAQKANLVPGQPVQSPDQTPAVQNQEEQILNQEQLQQLQQQKMAQAQQAATARLQEAMQGTQQTSPISRTNQ